MEARLDSRRASSAWARRVNGQLGGRGLGRVSVRGGPRTRASSVRFLRLPTPSEHYSAYTLIYWLGVSTSDGGMT